MSNPFLQPGECFIDLPDSECGAFNDRVSYSPPEYTCRDCGYVLLVETDIEGDTDSDFQPGEKDGTDGEGEDDEASSDTGPVDPIDVDDTPEEAMTRDTQKKLRQIIADLEESELPTDYFTSFFIDNFDEVVQFYMLFTKYGPFPVVYRPDKKEEIMLQTSCAYMMLERKLVRFQVLAKAIGYSEQGLIRRALFFIETYKGEDFGKGAFLIPIYSKALKVPASFNDPMEKMWLEIIHPRGALRDRVVAFIIAYAKASELDLKILQQAAATATGVTRGTLSPKVKEYQEIIKGYLNQ